ncbi:uncharacterized protein LOC123470625 [Daphnia magna]|uniref:uncharacterized protein LOC123470625 n=1 Tax=Daphnia magna TaxID=35525 RepID=UPI001E1BB0ED|nr:uncharacterized protein LOC123470625 [Daphnia magna]
MCFVYLDDVLVFGKNFQEHQERLELVLMALEKAKTQEAAKQNLVQYLTSAPVLAHYDEKLDVVIQTDASNLGLGAVLLQDDGAGPRPVAFVRHLKGSSNVMADALSRNPDEKLPESETDHVIFVLQTRKPSGYAPHEFAFLQQVDNQLRKIFLDLSYPNPEENLMNFWKILNSCHDDSHAGHMGRKKTFARVSERYWWAKMFLHKHAVGQTVGRLQPISLPAHAFEMLGIDHLGPLQTTDSGNKYVIVAINYLTKWMEVAAVPDTSTSHVIPFIQDNIIHRHSHPKRLVSDQGPAFSSKEFDTKLTEWRIDHIPATPEHPQTNGLCERLNKTAALAGL